MGQSSVRQSFKISSMPIVTRLVRYTGFISISYAALIWCDLLLPARTSDSVVVISKEISPDHGGKYNPTFGLLREYCVTGKGHFVSYGDLVPALYESVRPGDTLNVFFSGVFQR